MVVARMRWCVGAQEGETRDAMCRVLLLFSSAEGEQVDSSYAGAHTAMQVLHMAATHCPASHGTHCTAQRRGDRPHLPPRPLRPAKRETADGARRGAAGGKARANGDTAAPRWVTREAWGGAHGIGVHGRGAQVRSQNSSGSSAFDSSGSICCQRAPSSCSIVSCIRITNHCVSTQPTCATFSPCAPPTAASFASMVGRSMQWMWSVGSSVAFLVLPVSKTSPNLPARLDGRGASVPAR